MQSNDESSEQVSVSEYGKTEDEGHSLAFSNPVALILESQNELARDVRENVVLKSEASTTSISLKERNSRTDKMKVYFEGALVCLAIAVIWGLLSLPTVYFFMSQVNKSFCIYRIKHSFIFILS